MKHKCMLAALMTTIILAGNISPVASQESSLIGDEVQSVLTPGYSTDTITPFTALAVQVADPGIEFTGELRSYWGGATPYDYTVAVDIFSDYFTVTIEATNEWLTTDSPPLEVTAFGVGGDTASVFDIQLSDLDLPGGIGPVAYDPSRSTGYFWPGYIRELTWDTDLKQVNLRFAWVRNSVTYAFALQAENLIPDAAVDELIESIETINDLDPDVLPNENAAHALTNKIDAAIELIDEGFYEEALDKLQHDILGKTDGCANLGYPDRNDWITDCADQAEVYAFILEAIELLESLIE